MCFCLDPYESQHAPVPTPLLKLTRSHSGKDRLNLFITKNGTCEMMSEFGDCSVRKIVFNEDRDLNTHAIESPGLHPLTYKDLQIQVLYGVKKLNALGFHGMTESP